MNKRFSHQALIQVSAFLLTLLLFQGCFNDDVSPESPQAQEKNVIIKSMTAIVGKKLKNPYSIRNMIQAEKNLLGRGNSSVARVLSNGLHWYVKFKPQTSEEVGDLIADSLKLFDFPFDHKLTALPDTTAMDYDSYADGEIPELYTVVNENYAFSSIEHEILDTLVFPTAEQEELDYEAHLLTGTVDSTILNSGGRSKLFGVGTKPSGFIRVTDSQRGVQPVVGAYVQVIHFGLLVGAYTNTSGYFSIDRRFVAGTHVSVVFENTRCKIKALATHTAGAVLSIPAQLAVPAVHVSGTYSAGSLDNIDINFQSNTQPRLWATMINAVHWFNQYAAPNQMGWPGKIVMYAHWGRNAGSSSAPMLRYVSGAGGISGLYSPIINDNSFVLNPQITSALNVEKPDVTIKKGNDEAFNSVELAYVVFHELGHVSHYARVGSSFWLPYIQYIVANNGYGNRNNSGSGRIALSEAWADYVGENFGSQYYGLTTFRGARTFAARLENPFRDWIPYGMYFDHLDPFNPTEIWDNVNGISVANMYTALTADIDTPQRFRDRIRSGRPTAVQTNINALFIEYGWN